MKIKLRTDKRPKNETKHLRNESASSAFAKLDREVKTNDDDPIKVVKNWMKIETCYILRPSDVIFFALKQQTPA